MAWMRSWVRSPPQYGKVWVHLGVLKRIVKKEEVSDWLILGWKFGQVDRVAKKKKRPLIIFRCQKCQILFPRSVSYCVSTLGKGQLPRFCSKPCNAAFYHEEGRLRAPG